MTDNSELKKIKQLLDNAEAQIREAKVLLFESSLTDKASKLSDRDKESLIIEGVFDGEKMIGSDQKSYQVSANYASKSKLVAGDVLKLTILSDGSFLYKQIGPVNRKKIIGTLCELGDGKYAVQTDEGRFQVLAASISYFKASPGDKVSVLIPEDETSDWAAVENIIL